MKYFQNHVLESLHFYLLPERAGGWPPCIRVIVTESNCLSVGTLFIVTCTGATVGREKDMNHTIRIPDLSVSKVST